MAEIDESKGVGVKKGKLLLHSYVYRKPTRLIALNQLKNNFNEIMTSILALGKLW